MYNLAILYFTEGCSKMDKPSMDERKIATQKFRFALWCINQAKNLAVSLAPEVKAVQTDLCEANLEILYHMILGNCYSILYSNLVSQEAAIKVNNIGKRGRTSGPTTNQLTLPSSFPFLHPSVPRSGSESELHPGTQQSEPDDAER